MARYIQDGADWFCHWRSALCSSYVSISARYPMPASLGGNSPVSRFMSRATVAISPANATLPRSDGTLTRGVAFVIADSPGIPSDIVPPLTRASKPQTSNRRSATSSWPLIHRHAPGRDHFASLGARDAGAAHLAGRVDNDWGAAGASRHSAARCHRRAATGRQRRARCLRNRKAGYFRLREAARAMSRICTVPITGSAMREGRGSGCMGCATASSRRLSVNSCCRAL